MIIEPSPRLCLVTDRRALPGSRTDAAALAALEAQCEEAIAAGIDDVQLREFDVDARALAGLAGRLVAGARGTSTRILVNDRADVARVSGAGLHLRSGGPAAARVRALFERPMIVTRSVHRAEELAGEPDVDVFLFGTVFPSRSKPAGSAVAGLDGLEAAVGATPRPVLAIGGVTPANAGACRAAGASGVAAIGVFLPPGSAPGALGPAAAARALRDAWNVGTIPAPQ